MTGTGAVMSTKTSTGTPAGTGYEVDLDALKTAVKQLQGLLSDMDATKGKANYNTNLKPSQFGTGFAEAEALAGAHDTMRDSINKMITTLNSMISDFSDKVGYTHDAYANQDAQTVTQLS